MNRISTFQELFRCDDWARDKLLEAASHLPDRKLDQQFEMGCQTLRATLIHLHEAQLWWVWMCMGEEAAEPPQSEPIAELSQRWRETARRRDAFLASAADSILDRAVKFVDRVGDQRSHPVSDVLLHVINHGMHHRPQANNMLRRLELPASRIDYIFMKFQTPDAPALSVRVIQDFFAYADWAQARVLNAAASLSDEQLDRPFDMGCGSLRKTLVHICDAERWWQENWTRGPHDTFPIPRPAIPVTAIREEMTAVEQSRNKHLSQMRDDDLQRDVKAQPRPDYIASFPIGQTMLQLCNHGTHHRAQALNMLRHLGAPATRMDYLVMMKEMSQRA
jgi:uncharacterized damage-inducible protein DinB